ncbi:MAG: sensor domain-containing diguanylate cyclase [Acidimicrobiales bacterium]
MAVASRRQPTRTGSARTRAPLARRFQLRYLLAIALFAVMLIVRFTATAQAFTTVDERSAQVTASSEQESRLYRIADLSTRIALTDGDTTSLSSQLQVEAANLRATQRGLDEGDPALALPAVAPTEELTALLDGDAGLNAQVYGIADDADAVAALAERVGPGDEQLAGPASSIVERAPETAQQVNAVTALYDGELDDAIDEQRQAQTITVVIAVILAIVLVAAVFQPMARQISNETASLEEAERQHRENNERQTFRNDLRQALEHVQSEHEIIDAVGRAIESVVPENRAELLLAEQADGRLQAAQVNPLVGAAGCPIDGADACPAIRRGQTMVYESSRMLNVCPKLPQHAESSCSAVCAPLMFSGQALGVLHVTGGDGHPPSPTQIERLGVLATETSSRLGTLRASQATELQATTDGLTGLLNRRSVENRVRSLLASSRSFSVALADLDHFKDLNDTYGHEAGDRALRLFAKVLRDGLRPEDIPARYGGEEFVVVLPDTPPDGARAVLERLQQGLAGELAEHGGTPFTASWGLSDRTTGTTFDEIVAVADAALYAAKRAGRNCIVSGTQPATPVAPVAPTIVASAAPTVDGVGDDGHGSGVDGTNATF